MICDYAILKVTQYGIESLYESGLKNELLDLFAREFLCSNISDIDRSQISSIIENIVQVIHKKGYILYNDDDAIYVFCKFWRCNCEKCSQYDWIPGKVYKVLNRRLCLGCAYEILKQELEGVSDRAMYKEELLKLLML